MGDSWKLLTWVLNPTSLIFLDWPYPAHSLMLGTESTGIYRSDDSGKTWNQLNNGLEDLTIYALTYTNPTDSAPIPLAGTGKGIYFLTSSQEWKLCSISNLPARSISVFHRLNPLYAALGAGSYSDGIYKSVHFGESWEVSTWVLYPTAVLINQLNPNTVYAADSGGGVIITRNGGETWRVTNEGLGNLNVLGLGQSESDTNQLYAGTEAGLWVYDFAVSLKEDEGNRSSQLLVPTVSSNPVKLRYCISDQSNRVELSIFDPSGAVVTKTSHSISPGWYDMAIVLPRNGVYFIRIRSHTETMTKKIIVVTN